MNMKLCVALVVSAAACTEDASVRDNGNEALGIARFEISESITTTRVIGFDASEHEVARLDLVHGRFALTGVFKDDSPDQTEVDGRKLDVSVEGVHKMTWETAGYDPTLQLPAIPSNKYELRTFMDDPHVKVVLARWGIGFEIGQPASDESPYNVKGFDPSVGSVYNCLSNNPNTACGTAYNGTMNTCGGGSAPISAVRAQHTVAGGFSYDEYTISQCCPAGSGGQSSDWFAIKACPTTSSNSTSCGTRTSGACKACPAYPVDDGLGCQTADDGYGTALWCYDGKDEYASCTSGGECCSGACIPENNVYMCCPLWSPADGYVMLNAFCQYPSWGWYCDCAVAAING